MAAADLRVAVVGGSIGGLCSATALRTIGCDVHVYERAPHALESRGAGIVVQPDLTDLLQLVGAHPLPTTSCTKRRYLEPSGGAGKEVPAPQDFTSWEAINRTLRGAFPNDRYHNGADVAEITVSKTGVNVQFENGTSADVDLLVGADGWRSALRARFLPEVQPHYAGYVAFRGTVDEANVPAELLAGFRDRFTFCESRNGHALCYPIPGANAATEPGRRRLNWVWYQYLSAGFELDRFLTDRFGKLNVGAVGPGMLAEDVVDTVRENARHELHPWFVALIAATAEPFVQVILDLVTPQMRFGRAVLVGDAAFVVRPHTAGATAKAASDGLALARALLGNPNHIDRALSGWEQTQLRVGAAMSHYGVSLGAQVASAR